MRKEIARLVLPVLRKAIEIKENLRADPNRWRFADEQQKLLAMLQAQVPEHLRADMLGDQRAIDATSRGFGFLGIRYGLSCWLDEIFIRDTPWRADWNEHKVETTLYRMTDRANEFWRQAELARSRPTVDALEVYYLCVMLGFRGEPPEQVPAWRDKVEAQITQGDERKYDPPPGLTLTPNVRPLKGAAVMHTWAMIAIVIGLLYIPLLIVLVGSPAR